MGSFSIWHWLIVLLIVTVFGTKKLKNIGSDLAVRSKASKTHERRWLGG